MMPPLVQFVLTRRLPCAGLALMMFAAPLWSYFFSAMPPLAALVSLLGTGLNMLVPALFALILFGGGVVFTLQVAGLAAIVLTVVTGFSLGSGLLFFLLYALLPTLAAASLTRAEGLSRSAGLMAIGLFLATMAGLLFGASAEGLELRAFVEQQVAPLFESLAAAVPGSQPEALDALQQAKRAVIWGLPGFLAFSFWMVWWLDLLLGRRVAVKYGFYRGDRSQMLMLRFDRVTGIALIISALLANFAEGGLQYVAVAAAIMLAGMVALQGISVAHLWLKLRNMQMTLVVMYVMLLIWSAMIVPFIIAGLLDIWFDFRRSFMPANGEE